MPETTIIKLLFIFLNEFQPVRNSFPKQDIYEITKQRMGSFGNEKY